MYKDNEKIDELKDNYLSTVTNSRRKLLIELTVKLTKHPKEWSRDDINQMKKGGLSDKTILHAVLIIAYFNFVNRIALGLGAPHSENEVKGYKIEMQ